MNVDEMVSKGLFREDLLYRINTVEIELPPLRERPEDIPELADFFLNEYQKKYGKTGLKISSKVLDMMQDLPWNGNIRELQHMIEKAVILADGSIIEAEDIRISDTSAKSTMDQDPGYNIFENEKVLIKRALEQFNYNMSQTAKELGINRSTLYDKIKKYEL